MILRRLFFVLPCLLLVLFATELRAQIQVDLSIKRRLFILYEPIIATVNVQNRTGRDVTLVDADGNNWFSFQIMTEAGRVVGPAGGSYALKPLTIRSGESVRRTVNLTELYAIRDFGLQRVRASIYFDGMHQFFSSGYENIEITDGKTIWEEKVGVPEGLEGAGGERTLSLLTFRQPKYNMLYARIIDPKEGVVYCNFELGRVILSDTPQEMLDSDNNLHVLQLIGPKTFLYSAIGINGEWRGNKVYRTTKYRPRLKKTSDGAVGVAGGEMDAPVDLNAPPPPSVSDRPPGLPEE